MVLRQIPLHLTHLKKITTNNSLSNLPRRSVGLTDELTQVMVDTGKILPRTRLSSADCLRHQVHWNRNTCAYGNQRLYVVYVNFN